MNMNDREKLAIACYCRTFLYLNGFITEYDNRRIHERIKYWQNKNKIGITEAQLDSIEVTYDDTATYKEDEK